MNNTQKLTYGPIWLPLVKFALPFLGASFLQALYGTTDMLIVSYFGDASVLSGVGIGAQVIFAVMCLIAGLTTGGTILIGQYFGANKTKDVQETIGTMFGLFSIVGVIMTVLFLLLTPTLVDWLQTPKESVEETKHYLYFGALGICFTFGYNGICAVLRGLGDSKNPLKFITIACLCNIVLDFLFVGAFNWGAGGASLATTLSQGISLFFAIRYLNKNKFIFDFKFKNFLLIPDKIKMILKIGIPVSFQDSILMISFLFVLVIVNKMGVYASAAAGITEKIDGLTIIPSLAFSSAVSVMVAQNIGAGHLDRARQVMFTGLLTSLCFGVPMFFLMSHFPSTVMSWTTNNPEIIRQGADYIYGYSADCILLCVVFALNGFLNGCGKTTFTMLNNVFAALFVRLPLVYIATDLFEVGWALPIVAFPQILFALFYFYTGRWKKGIIKNISTQENIQQIFKERTC